MYNELKLFYQNTRGLRTKIISGLRNKITIENYDFVCLTETWLNSRFDSECIFDSDLYTTHRADRNEYTYNRLPNSQTTDLVGGGALIAIRKNISAFRLENWEQEVPFDNVWLRISTIKGKQIFINCIYLNHSTSFDRFNQYLKQLQDIINVREPNSEFIIVGDFNLPWIEWYATPSHCIALSHEGRLSNELLNTLALTELSQRNNVRNAYNRTLDLVVTNITHMNVEKTHGIVNEDAYHPALLMKCNLNNIKYMKSKKTIKYNFFKCNFAEINTKLNSINWTELFMNLNINETVNKFYDTINKIIDENVPKIRPRSHEYPKWFSNKLIRLIREKEYYFKLKSHNSVYARLYSDKRKEVKHERKKCIYEYENNVEALIKSNPKSFFAYTKSLRKSNSLPAVMRYKNILSENMKETANLFANYF